MLTEIEHKRYVIFEHKLPKSAVDYIDATRTSEPSRMVGSHAKNSICSWVPSTKMGRTISVDSRSCEFGFDIICHYYRWVLEIWDQPEVIKVKRTNKNGVKRSGSYTPDFLILTEYGPEVIEVKSRSDVDKLIDENPDDWKQLENGDVEYIPAKERFAELGLSFKVFVYENDMGFLIHNLSILLKTRDEQHYPDKISRKVEKAFDKSFSWTLSDLKEELDVKDYTSILQLIDEGFLKVDLKQDLLSSPDSCVVARSEFLLDQARELFKDNQVYKSNFLSKIPVSISPSEKQAQKALEKLEKINNGETGRSIRRWKNLIDEGAKQFLTPFQSLLPKYYKQGNRDRKINKLVEEFLLKYLEEIHAPSSGISIYRSYIRYKDLATEDHPLHDPVCKKTFYRRLSQIPPEDIARKRGGKRAANAVADATDPLKRNLKAQIAWEIAAIDHYLADIYLIFFSVDGTVHVQKPWVTAMIDLYSTSVLALSISFLSPSRRSVAKVIRECVRRHGKLPSEIIVDRGSDFRSVYYASLLAHFKIIHSLRAASYPQYGGEVEGLCGEFKKQWLSQRRGNTVDYKEVRAVDGNKSPKKDAILRPEDFYREINAFCAWRDNKCKGTGERSAVLKFQQSTQEFPFMAKSVDYDAEFLLATAVETKEYTVDFRKGIKMKGMWYYSPDIRKVRGKKGKLDVRVDPENPHVIYALIENEWCPCYSSGINTYSAKSPVSQLIEGLTAYEAETSKAKVKEQDDLELVRKIREMDDLARDDNLVPVIELDRSLDDRDDPLDLDGLQFAEVQPYSREAWG